MKPVIKRDLLIVVTLVLVGVLMRVPYLAMIPTFKDEVMQTVYALDIRPGEFMPLVGNDPYAGPFFSYLIALSMRLFGSTPVTPRVVVMLMGALTVGLTYLLARALGLRWPWAALAGLLMAANPHHILINSHYAGATYTLPLFSTAFLLALVLAVQRGSGRWLVAAGALLGLALQANPVPLLMLPGVAVWFLIQHKSVIGLRTRWPYLALVALLLVYAPVIIYNVLTGLVSVKETEIHRAYIWQPDPSPITYVHNLWRLILQVCRQVSGVLEGDETLRSLVGVPLLLSAWAIAGLIYAARRSLSLPAMAVGSQTFIMPWLSNFYGMTGAARFTIQLTPLILVAMGELAADAWDFVHSHFLPSPAVGNARQERGSHRMAMTWLSGALLVALSLWPLVSLFQYYEHAVTSGETNAPHFALYDEFARQWRGEKVFIDDSGSWYNVMMYFWAINSVPYHLMSPNRILEQLATGQEMGGVVLLLYNENVARFKSQADLIAWESPVIQTARELGYGLYGIADAQQVRKPTFVFTDAIVAPTVQAVQANFADELGMIGYEIRLDKATPGGELVVNVHWEAISVMRQAYTGFVHLIGPNGQLVAQDDHELGRGLYRTIFWQPGEVVREKYVLTVPKGSPGGEYSLRVGVYNFPSLRRLAVRSASVPAQDDVLTLSTISVTP